MAGALDHRAPDGEHHWIDAENGLVVVHKNRSTPGRPPNSEQPLISSDGRFVLSMDGILHNSRDLCSELSAMGARMVYAEDPELVLEGIVHWGLKETLEKLSGGYAFALWDRRKCELHLVRDRSGTKPLYYGWSDGHLLFGSELHALEAFPGFRSHLCPRAVALYTERGFVPAPYSLWQQILKVASGTFVTFGLSQDAGTWPEPHVYWDFGKLVDTSRSTPFRGATKDAVDKCDRLIHHAVRQRMSDNPAGVLLDQDPCTHLVAAVLQRESPHPITTVSVDMETADGAIAQTAKNTKEIALRIGTHHQAVALKPQDIWASVPRMAQICDEPNGDIAVIQQFLALRQTSATTKHLMTAHGGQDLFGIQDPYGLSGIIGPITDYLPAPFNRTMGHVLSELAGKIRASGLPQTQNGLLHRLCSARTARFATALQSEHPSQIYKKLTGDWISSNQVMAQDITVAQIEDLKGVTRQALSFSEQMMFLDTATTLPDCELSIMDRSSSTNGVRASHPLLDHSLIAFAWTLPATMKFGRTSNHRLLSRLLGRYLPQSVLEKSGRSAVLPVATWLREPLRDWAERLVDPRSIDDMGLLDGAILQAHWRELQAGRDQNQSAIWNSLTLLDWFHERRARGLVA